MSDRIVVMNDGAHPADRHADGARALPQERLRRPLHGRQQHGARADRVGRRRHHHDPRAARCRPRQGHREGRRRGRDDRPREHRRGRRRARRPRAEPNTAQARLNFAEYLGDSVKLHLDVAGEPFTAKVAETRYAEMRETRERRTSRCAGTSRTGTSLSSEEPAGAQQSALAEIEEIEAQLGEKPLAVAATSGIKRSGLATFLWAAPGDALAVRLPARARRDDRARLALERDTSTASRPGAGRPRTTARSGTPRSSAPRSCARSSAPCSSACSASRSAIRSRTSSSQIKSLRKQIALFILVLAPFWTAYLIRVIAWNPVLGRNGAINYLADKLGFGPVRLPALLGLRRQPDARAAVRAVHGDAGLLPAGRDRLERRRGRQGSRRVALQGLPRGHPAALPARRDDRASSSSSCS